MRALVKRGAAALVCFLMAASGASAQYVQCEPPGGFSAWLESFKRAAVAQGVSQRTVSAALDGVTPNPEVLRLDRNQTAFRLSFEEFARQRVTQGRINQARQRMRQHADLLVRIEQRFGVPPEMLMAIWGMETDFGAVTGNMSVVRSLATLGHDCRRTEMFQSNLMAALRIIDRGDLSMQDLRGAWAGEIGQAQFLATSYERFAVDFDGNGRRDLIRSVPDVLASIANYLASHGWRRGEPWDEGTHNFTVLREWNRASVYQRALALFANRLRDGGPATAGGGSGGLSFAQVQELQQLLARRGHDVGPADGVVGPRTRAAIAAEQRRLGIAVDSAPSEAFLTRLRQ
jgi:lytic murein transglycosylase